MWIRVKSLGEGGSGFVYLAQLSGDDEEENLLNLPPQFAVKSAKFIDSQSLQFERELLNELQFCDSIIQCYGADASEEDGEIFYDLMLEYAAGGSLADRIHLSKVPLTVDEVKRYAKSVLMGLRFIHGKGFAHLDIKPSNILLVDDGAGRYIAKIADFGLAKEVREKPDPKRREGERFLRGTAIYMAPESIVDDEYDSKVDVWALGCTVLEMITKKRLWEFKPKVEKIETLLDRIVSQEVRIPSGLSRDARDFLEKCLIKNPKERWSADMLLKHSFVSCSDKETTETGGGGGIVGACSEISTISCSNSKRNHEFSDDEEENDWLMKPMLLLNRGGVDSGRGKRRKVTEEEDSVRAAPESNKEAGAQISANSGILTIFSSETYHESCDEDNDWLMKPMLLLRDGVAAR